MPETELDSIDETRMSLGDHLEELRWRVLYALIGLVLAMVLALFFGKELIGLLTEPFRNVTGYNSQPTAVTITGAFLTYMQVSLIAGLILSSPWIFYQLWKFVAAGLYPNEKRHVWWVAPACAFLFVCGALFFLRVVSYPMLRFFMTFTDWMEVAKLMRLKELVSFMAGLMFMFGLAFQMPLVVLALGKMGLVTPPLLGKYRRHVIVGLLILSAVATSPSPVDQVLLAAPMWLLYELGIILVRIFASDKK